MNDKKNNDFDNVICDILLRLESIKYNDIDRDVIKTNIMFNLFFFCKDEIEFEKNYNILKCCEHIEDDNKRKTIFDSVISDILSGIDNLRYSDINREIIKEKIKKTISLLCKSEFIFEKNIDELKKEKNLGLIY